MRRDQFFVLVGLILLMWSDIVDSTFLLVGGLVYLSAAVLEPLLKLAIDYFGKRRRRA